MGTRSVLFAIDEADVSCLRAAVDDDARVHHVTDVIEERWDEEHLTEIPNLWDPIHRSLTDGRLAFDNGSFPRNRCILGGERLTHGDYIISFTSAELVPEVASSLAAMTREEFAAGCALIDADEYGPDFGEEDLERAWECFEDARALWLKASEVGRAVIFTVGL